MARSLCPDRERASIATVAALLILFSTSSVAQLAAIVLGGAAALAIAAADGMGIPLSLADPDITPASAARDVMAALRELLRPDG